MPSIRPATIAAEISSPVLQKPTRPQPQPQTAPAATPAEARPVSDPSAVDLNLPRARAAVISRSCAGSIARRWKRGCRLALDTEKDTSVLFDRFRRNIYNVWNYPPQAVKAREQGIRLLEIVIHRNGSVDSVAIKDSSGFPALDREAVAAVYRGAPYGQLPSAYSEEKLKIMAFFQYRLSLSGQRGGDIFGAR
ncbi:MAG: TonB family protein [Syntrophotaleaceae bacterium]